MCKPVAARKRERIQRASRKRALNQRRNRKRRIDEEIDGGNAAKIHRRKKAIGIIRV